MSAVMRRRLLLQSSRYRTPLNAWNKSQVSLLTINNNDNQNAGRFVAPPGVRAMVVVVTKSSSSTTCESLHEDTSSTIPVRLNDSSKPSMPVVPLDSTTTTTTVSQQQTVLITDSCWKRIHQLVAGKQQTDESGTTNNNLFLRVFVDAGGCSGFTYQFEMDNDTNLLDDDVVFVESNPTSSTMRAARVVIDHGSLQFIAGSKIDYVQEMIKSSFEVRDNPLSESACGCGSSFALKNFASNPALD